MQTVRNHVETVMEVIHSGDGEAFDTRESLIHRSWRRCYTQHALDPAGKADVRIETASRLRECRKRCEEHLHVARAGMEQLYKHVSDLGYVLLLTDADGVTLDFIGNDTWDAPLRRAGLAMGANWNEVHAGTNGIGTCLAERATVLCDRDDHYYIGNVALSCISTPLYDPEGTLMGALDISALSSHNHRDSLHLARHLAELHGRMIEDANFIRQFRENWIIRLGRIGLLVDVCGELMLAVDRDGRIVGANTGARQRLKLADASGTAAEGAFELVGNHLSGIFSSRIDDVWRLTKGSGDASSAITTWDGQGYHVSMIAPKAAPRVQVSEPQRELHHHAVLSRLSGNDPCMEQLIDNATRLLDKSVSILIRGETGTGKEVLARALHDASRRADKPFIAVNCAAIPETLIESELFGYEAGTFTGARSKGMKGLVQRSDGGTLFLDEIGDMPLALQTRLLRVLAENEVLPLGADKPIRVNLHVISASHRDLRRHIAAGSFREDLYYRLCGATLALPALRERADKPYLVQTILEAEAAAMGGCAQVDETAMQLLMRHEWPGNIRELRNALRYALSLAEGHPIGIEHLPQDVTDAVPDPATGADVIPFPQVNGNDRDTLQHVLRAHRWNITDVARVLGTCRATVYRRMKRLGIVSPTQTH